MSFVPFILLLAFAAYGQEHGDFKDSRDGKTYRVVKIGYQTWMAENLNYKAKKSKCYENQENNCKKYGRLYNWKTALNACPADWRLPTRAEWDTLTTTVGGSLTDGKYLKATRGWKESGNGTDVYGFAALPGGYGITTGSFYDIDNNGYWWSATESSDKALFVFKNKAYYRSMYYNSVNAHWYDHRKSGLFSVRCLKD